MIKLLSVLSMFLFFVVPCFAQGTYTANSGNNTAANPDVQNCVNGTSCVGGSHTPHDGDKITIPAGSYSWTLAVVAPSGIGITLTGTGTPNSLPTQYGASSSCISTVITDELSSGIMLTFTPAFGNSTTRISCFQLLPFLPYSGYSNPVNINGTCAAGGCPNLRIDNISTPNSWSPLGLPDSALFFVNNMFGVADHNSPGDVPPTSSYVDFINLGHSAWLSSSGGYGDLSWASADTFGTSQAFYLENNKFTFTQALDTDIPGVNGGGARVVCRFNQHNMYAFGTCTGHGTETTGRSRGIRQWEIYDDTNQCTNNWGSQNCGSTAAGRSGVGRNFENSLQGISPGFIKGITSLQTQRVWRGPGFWGFCDGLIPQDTNDGVVYATGKMDALASGGSCSTLNTCFTLTDNGTVGGTKSWTTNQWSPTGAAFNVWDITKSAGAQISGNGVNTATIGTMGGWTPTAGDSYEILRATVCLDQATRSGGTLYSGATPTPSSAANQVLDPTYEASDSMTGNTTQLRTIDAPTDLNLLPNRDFYVESNNQAAQTSATSPFNGTSGSGHGTLAFRPATCTTGVGYWATDQGSWNTTTNLSPVTGNVAQGELFICASTNTWTLSYMPYTYPHPLTISGGGGSFSCSPSIILFGAVNQNSGSLGESTTCTNTTASTVTLTGGNITSAGGFASQFSIGTVTCGPISSATIAPGGNCTITILFTPTFGIGTTATGQFNLDFSGVSGSPIAVALNGTIINGIPGSSIPSFACTENCSPIPIFAEVLK